MKIEEGAVQIMLQGLPIDWRSTKYIYEPLVYRLYHGEASTSR